MYGHGVQPPTRTSGTATFLRVLFAAVGPLSCGLLAGLPLFRVAMLRGRRGDWLLAWLSLPVTIAAFATVGMLPDNDHRGDVAMAVLLLLAAFSTAHFLVFDVRHHRAAPPFAPLPSQTTAATPQTPVVPAPPHQGYGYPAPAPQPYAATQSPPTPYPPVPQPLQPPRPPQPQQPAPARIDQVRAELDELSDYLRKHEDGR
ncbi:hypothetical protein NGF19_14075 [Streptomyces sp. RY43-2]|uniref:Integral membrane protein n=1 Tax=Streptomyces macrolidinus TaxID=2952607 RepID=A0ABT0ZEB4_9ACTN|nr:hypothetical protein [Streptomyces macrolidinus]MCN9241904.1 hypothetical protein [Streptomyces macrolidinus]